MTTEDEVMRLLRRADPDRGRVHAPSVDSTDYLAALRTRSTTVTLIDTEPTPTQPNGRHRWPIIAAAAVVAISVGGLVIAARDDDATDDVPTNQPTTVAPATTVATPLQNPQQPPVEFTACVNLGPQVQQGTEETTTVSLPAGEMTIARARGFTWQSTVRDVSDPRLDGTWYNSADSDHYTIPGAGSDPEFMAWTHRIENDEGAWQGAIEGVLFAGETLEGPLVLIGEGAYEGLTAVAKLAVGGPCPNTRGYIIEGGVPAPPVPQTGQ